MFTLYLLGIELRSPAKLRFWAVVTLASAIVLSGSKGTYITVLVTLPIVFLGLKKGEWKKPLLHTLKTAVATALVVSLIFALTPLIQKNLNIGTNLFESVARVNAWEGSITDRLEFWRVSLRLLRNRPLTGYGYGSFFAAHYIEYRVNETYTRFAHSHYLQLAAELGIPGLLLFLGFIAACARSVFIKIRSRQFDWFFPGALAACIAFLGHVLIEFSWSFPAVPLVFFCMVGLAVGKNPAMEIVPARRRLRLKEPAIAAALVLAFLLTALLFSANKLSEKGLSVSDQGNLEAGIALYERSARIFPFSAANYYLTSENYLNRYQQSKNPQDLEQAIKLESRAVDLTPYSGKDHQYLAGLLQLANRPAEAESHYREAIRYNAYNLSAFMDFAAFYLKEDRKTDALSVLLDGSRRINRAVGSFEDPQERCNACLEGMVIDSAISKIYAGLGDSAKAGSLAAAASQISQVLAKEKENLDRLSEEQSAAQGVKNEENQAA